MDRITRRKALVAGASLAAGAALGAPATDKPMHNRDFKLKYAPHFGMFENSAGKDLVDQMKFARDTGFTAWEDNGMKGRSPQEQERIAKTMADLGITMGVFVVNLGTAWSPTLATGQKDSLDKFLEECRESVDVAKRVNAKWMTVVPGLLDHRLEVDYQTANVIEALRRASEIFEPHGLVMVLEPLNHWRDHPQLFLNKIPQAFLICRAVNSPACKILDDLYHQQIQEGNLIPNMDRAWSEIGYFQVGDNPGRREPLTGEINYRNIFKHIHGRGFGGVVGMEHGKSQGGVEGEQKLIEAYRWCDDF
jgi:hydroxypyruvate isomerase